MKALRETWWNAGIPFPFEIRYGINIGMAGVGKTYGSEGFMEYLAVGLSTNLASRLEQACALGEIYLSHATRGLVKEEIPCDEVGSIEMKGSTIPSRPTGSGRGIGPKRGLPADIHLIGAHLRMGVPSCGLFGHMFHGHTPSVLSQCLVDHDVKERRKQGHQNR